MGAHRGREVHFPLVASKQININEALNLAVLLLFLERDAYSVYVLLDNIKLYLEK